MTVDIYIENERIDVFETDSINITQSVQNINDISKAFADFSQSFSVPASDNNNRIFKHYYNADIDNGFDARLLKEAFININSIPFKFGKIRLEGADIQDNKPKTYKLTFFGNAIKVKDLIADDKLNDLEWLSNFNHEYTGVKVREGLTTGLDFTVDSVAYDRAIVYPLVSYGRQFFYSSDPTDTTATSTLVNIGYDAGRTEGVDFTDLKPAIKLSVILQAITEQYNLPFTSIFFNDERYTNCYMNLNNSVDSLITGLKVIETYDGTATQEQADNDVIKLQYSTTITPASGFEDTPYKIRLTYNNNVAYESSTFVIGTQQAIAEDLDLTTEYSVNAEVITQQDFDFDANTSLDFDIASIIANIYSNTYLGLSIETNVIITTELPNIKTYDFLTDLFKVFNLVAYANDEEIEIESLEDWYASGAIYDITKYVDTKKTNVKRGKIYREINFKFEESEQILADEYRQSNRENYGDLEFKLTNPDGTALDNLTGEILDIEVLFENPIHERLLDSFTGLQTTIQYTPYFDREIKGIAGNPFLLFCPTQDVSTYPIGYNTETTYESLNSIIVPSHSLFLNESSFNLNFNAVVNEYNGQVMPNTLFKSFYEDYISDMFSVKRRVYNYESILPTWLLNKLRLNDRLVIRNTRYIINKIQSNIVNRKQDADKLELINDIYDAPLASDSLNNSRFRDAVVNFNSDANSGSNLYYGVVGTVAKEDTGDGVAFVTLNTTTTINGVTQVLFDITENTTGASRTMRIRVTDGINNPFFTIVQTSPSVGVLNFSSADNSGFITTIFNTKP